MKLLKNLFTVLLITYTSITKAIGFAEVKEVVDYKVTPANKPFTLITDSSGVPSKIRIDNCLYDIPRNLTDLKSGFAYNAYELKENIEANLQLLGFVGFKFDKKDRVLILEYTQQQDYGCSDGVKVSYGAGVYFALRVSRIKSGIDLSYFSKLAASVEMGLSEVEFSYRTIGITGPKALTSIPKSLNFNVESYVTFQGIVDFIRNLKEEKDALVVTPQILPELK